MLGVVAAELPVFTDSFVIIIGSFAVSGTILAVLSQASLRQHKKARRRND